MVLGAIGVMQLASTPSAIGLLANPWGARVLAYAALLPASRTVTGMVTEWAPASIRDPAGAMLLAAIGVLVVGLARSRAHARVPEQLLRMALLAGLALWAVRASVWFALAFSHGDERVYVRMPPPTATTRPPAR